VAEQPARSFAELLRELRAEARLTQEELAEAASLSPRSVSDLERGIHRTAHRETARLLADALGLAEPVRGLFVAAARGRAPVAEVLAARAGAPAALAAAVLRTPAGPAAVPVPRELPADVGGFVGRAVELAELDLRLPDAIQGEGGGPAGPVVISAVSGTAGVGKTALAVRWAHRVVAAFPDGQLYVNLRGYDPDRPVSAAEALAGFLRALGVAGQDIPLEEAERAARYRSLVAGRRLLVVLDNAASVEQVRPLMPGTGSVMVVVTSRDSLAGLVAREGAHRLDLDLLAAADAVALLQALMGGRVEADPAAAEALAGLCARLPLALRVAAELAASRPDAPLSALVGELSGEANRLELLDAGGDPRGAVASVFSWSYRHLAPDAARMFRLLGLHPGPDWDRHAAAALAGASVAEAGRLLAVLARAHLIAPAGPGRYGMHDLLRAYAASHDPSQARHAALTGLFDYYLAGCAAAMDHLAPADRSQRPDPPPAVAAAAAPQLGDPAAARAWLDAELATLVAVAAYTASNGWPGHTTRLSATLFRYLDNDHNIEGLTIGGHALNAACDCDDHAAQAHELTRLGVFHDRQGHHHQAASYHQQAIDIARHSGDRHAEAIAVSNLAITYDQLGQYQLSADYYWRARTSYRQLGDQLGEATNLTNLGNLFVRQGCYQQAAETQQQALAGFRELGDQLGEAIALGNLGEIYYRLGDYHQAASHQRQALALRRESSHRGLEAEALTRLGEICNRLGDHTQADEYHQNALALYRKTGLGGEADALNGAGETLLATGQREQAHACHTAALALTGQTGNRPEQARSLTRLAAVFRQQGDYDQAASYDQQALTIYRQIGDPGGEAEALNGAGETLLATGQPDEAHTRHSAALSLTRQTGDRYQQARAHHGLAGACQAAGQPDQARQHWQHALDIYTDLGVPDAARMHASPALPTNPAAGTR
jgi:tetratricopeptide (TPR) repeat protein/transcriptional regulator with XRE-family HTH domain